MAWFSPVILAVIGGLASLILFIGGLQGERIDKVEAIMYAQDLEFQRRLTEVEARWCTSIPECEASK